MKRLLLLVITGMVLFSCNDNSTKETAIAKNSDWTYQNLKGMAKTVEETSYTPDSSGNIHEMDSCCIITDEYDSSGYISASSKKDSKGKVTETTSFTHYEKGQMKGITNTKDGKTSSAFAIDVDKDGKYSGARELDSAGKVSFYYTGLTEDDYGQVLSGTRHKADSTVDGVFKNSYTKGMQVGNEYTDSSGKKVSTSKSELNEKGDVIKTSSTDVGKDSTTNTVKTFTYESYDEKGNWTQRTTHDEKGKATKVNKRTLTYYKKD